jgi:hypothetical protein
MATWAVPGPASEALEPRDEVRHAEVIAMFGLDAFQVDLGMMTACRGARRSRRDGASDISYACSEEWHQW